MAETRLLKARDFLTEERPFHFAAARQAATVSAVPHRHDFFEWFYISSGSITHTVNGAAKKLSRGDLVFIRPDDIHFYRESGVKENFEFFNMAFSRRTLARLAKWLGMDEEISLMTGAAAPPSARLGPEESAALSAKLNIMRGRVSDAPAFARGCMIITAEVLSRLTEIGAETKTVSPKLIEICMKMRGKGLFTEGIPALKRIAGMNYSHLCRLFRSELGMTPTDYINALRLDHAAGLLSGSDLKIISVAWESGFSSLSHFNHLFLRRFGCSPKEFRSRRPRPPL